MYFEEYEIEKKFELPPVQLTEEEIIDFARQYDPRPFHLDPEAAKESRFGALISSGFQTLIVCWAQWVRLGLDADGMVAGMSIDRLRWLKPVYAQDLLYGTVTITGKKAFSDGKHGAVHYRLEVRNQGKEEVMEAELTGMIARKEQAGPPD